MDSAALLATLLQLAAAFSVYGPQPPQPPPQPPHRGGGYPPDLDCYERVAVGRRLNESAASGVLTAATARRCEQECERARCLAFSFGISHVGNGTCLLASKMPSAEETISDIDYDLFYKNEDCIKRIPCYKRKAIGRSLIDRLVRRSLLCDSLRACEDACQAERAFQCEGFNFKFDPNGVDNKCQLTDVKSHKLDLTRDFNPDVNFDFYDRDLNGPRQCFRGPEFEGGGGFPPSGGYPGSGPGEPGFPALGEEPPGGPRYPASSGSPGGPLYPPRLEPPGGPGGPHYPPPLEPPGGPPGYPPPLEPPGGAGYPPPLEPPGGQPGYPQPPGGHLYPLPAPPPGDNALVPLDYPDKGHEYGGGGAYSLGASRGGLPDECFLRSRSGFRLDRRVVLVSISVPSLYECESMCVSERKFKCNVFSFRYAVNPSVPTHNCHLGEKPYLELDPYQDLQPDRDFDVYERNPTGLQGCQPKKSWGPECFERVRSGLKLNRKMTKFALKCTSLKECEFACLNVPYFTCRAFSYRYGPPVIGEGEENCLLTDWPVPEMNAGQHLAEDPDCELYHRGSYGHGCEVDRAFSLRPPGALYPSGGEVGRPLPPRADQYPPPANEIPNSYPTVGGKPVLGGYYPVKPNSYLPPPQSSYLPPPPGGGGGSVYPNGRGDYYPHLKPSSGYLPPSQKPSGGYLPPPPPPRRPEGGYLPPSKEQDYPRKPCCSGGQNSYLPPPKSHPQGPPAGSAWETHGSFGGGRESYGSFGGRRPGDSYLPPPPGSYGGGGPTYDGRLHSSDQLCYVRYSSPARLLPKSIKNSLWVPGEAACKQECTRAREKTRFRCATLSYREGQCELSDIEQRDLRPGYDFLRDENDFWLFTWDFGAPGCVLSPPPPPTTAAASRPSYPGERGGDDTWSRFTVNGQPCLSGTACSLSPQLGVWSCPTSAGGEWDYCCRAGHHCGYSQGYDYPWCYVGETSREQWRPCSDTYLPYPHSGRKTHWPVAYLHREGPPNVTLTNTASSGSPHKPSIVESFLKSLEKSGIRPTTSPPVEGRSETTGTTGGGGGGGGEESALDKMLTWGKTALRNLTTAMTPPSGATSPPTSSSTTGNSTSSVGTTETTAGTTLTSSSGNTGGTLPTTTVLPTSTNSNNISTTQTSSTPSTQT